MSSEIELRDGEEALAVVYPDRGAWLVRYARHFGEHGWVDALEHDAAVIARYPERMWAGMPVLFPHVSSNVWEGKEGQYALDGQVYASPSHGFGRRVPWTVVEREPHSLTLELCEGPPTLPTYPFRFRTTVGFALREGTLNWEQVVENRDTRPLPFSTGFHPYFRVPLLPRSEQRRCYLRLPRCRRYNPIGAAESFFDEPMPAQDWSVAQDVSWTLFVGDLARREVVLVDPGAGLEMNLRFDTDPAYRFLAIWAPSPTSSFYCVEPWTALPNSFGRSDGELVVLRPGEVFRARLSIEIRRSQPSAL